ncbi:MAG: hypothetical protein VXA18_01465, partial [Gammaproteobacteria bacterium]
QKDVLNQLNRKIMEFWCKFIYGPLPDGFTSPNSINVEWVKSQYLAMNTGKYPDGKNQSDGELMRLFKGSISSINLGQNPQTAKQLLSITTQAYNKKNSIKLGCIKS